MKEAAARIKINKLLEAAGWVCICLTFFLIPAKLHSQIRNLTVVPDNPKSRERQEQYTGASLAELEADLAKQHDDIERKAIIHAIGRIGAGIFRRNRPESQRDQEEVMDDARKYLAWAYQRESDPKFRKEIVRAYGFGFRHKNLDLMFLAIHDPSPVVAEFAKVRLAEILKEPLESRDAWMSAAKNSDPAVRIIAAQALSAPNIYSIYARELGILLGDPDPSVRLVAQNSFQLDKRGIQGPNIAQPQWIVATDVIYLTFVHTAWISFVVLLIPSPLALVLSLRRDRLDSALLLLLATMAGGFMLKMLGHGDFEFLAESQIEGMTLFAIASALVAAAIACIRLLHRTPETADIDILFLVGVIACILSIPPKPPEKFYLAIIPFGFCLALSAARAIMSAWTRRWDLTVRYLASSCVSALVMGAMPIVFGQMQASCWFC